MSSIDAKSGDDVRLDDIATKIVSLVKEHLTRGVPTQLKLGETMHPATLELQMQNSKDTRNVEFPASPFFAVYQNRIMARVCALLTADGFTVNATTPLIDFIMSRPNVTESPPQPSRRVGSTKIVPDRPSLSVASVRAMHDARIKEAEARRKAEQDEKDHKTFQTVQQRIIDGKDVVFFDENGKFGYRVSFTVYADMDDWFGSIRRIIPLLQDAVGPSEKVTFAENPLCCTVTVMEI